MIYKKSMDSCKSMKEIAESGNSGTSEGEIKGLRGGRGQKNLDKNIRWLYIHLSYFLGKDVFKGIGGGLKRDVLVLKSKGIEVL